MTRIQAISAYPGVTPGPRVRIVEHIPGLSAGGIDLRFEPTVSDDEYTALVAGSALSRRAAIVGRSALRARRARRDGLRMVHRLTSLVPAPGADGPLDVYDFDDALHLPQASGGGGRIGALKAQRRRFVRAVTDARLVVAGNDHLAGIARGLGAARVEVVPSCVDPERFEVRDHSQTDTVVVGWIGSASTTPYLERLREVIGELPVPIRVIGVGASTNPREDWFQARPWALEREADDLASFDIGVMPLPDDDWTRGKCGYKLLQYYAAGLPVVAAPVGVNAALLDGGGGISAVGHRAWVNALTSLAYDATERQERGRLGRAYVERHYSFATWSPRLAELLRELT